MYADKMKKFFFKLFLLFNLIYLAGKPAEFNIATSSLELTLNPFYTYTANEAQMLTGIYEGLVSYNPKDLSPMPALAESWILSEDKKTYTFILRKNIKFSNGDPITAETFKNSFLKILNPKTDAEFSSLLDIIENAREFRTGSISNPNEVGISVEDDNKLVIKLKDRAPYFTKILCHHSFTPIHPNLLNTKNWTLNNVITSGAYTISQDEKAIVLKKSNNYWDKDNVYFDRINIIKYEDSNKATADYNLGNIDWITDNSVNINLINDLETLHVNSLFATTYYYFNTNYKEYKNDNIRKAISLLIPWNKIRENQYIPADTLVPALSNFPQNSVSNIQNIDEALQILEENGYKNGKGLSDLIISIPENTYTDGQISEIIKENIEKNTEIKVIIKETKYPDFFSINKKEEYTISTLSWIGDFADPLTFLEMWTSTSNLNDTGFTDILYDELIESSSIINQTERYKILSTAEKILLDKNIVIPINHSPGINVIDSRFINNWYENALDIHPYKFLGISPRNVIPGLI